MFDRQLVAQWLQAERCRQALTDFAQEFCDEHCTLLVFKGIHLAYVVADQPWRREVSDVDVVLLDGNYRTLLTRIGRSAKWTLDKGRYASIAIASNGTRVDLHRTPTPPPFSHLMVLAQRSRPAPLFGEHVFAPDPADAAVLAAVHFTKDGAGTIGHGRLADDLRLLHEKAELHPSALAERARELGFRRATLVALSALAQASPEWRRWLDACSPSALERALARRVLSLLRRAGGAAPLFANALLRDGLGEAAIGTAIGLLRAGRALAR